MSLSAHRAVCGIPASRTQSTDRTDNAGRLWTTETLPCGITAWWIDSINSMRK